GRMADDEPVGPHRQEVSGRVQERLAFFQAGASGGKVQNRSSEPSRRHFERNPGPRGRLHEEIDDRLPFEDRKRGRRGGGLYLGKNLSYGKDAPNLLGA